MHEKIFIVGFMASGKTTYGRQLAEEKGYPFYDTDALIEEKIGMSVTEFFAHWGEKYFRRMERDVLYGLLSRQESFVCATGGGSVCQPDIMDWLNRAGDTVWLDTPWEVIEERLTGDTTRPLVAQHTAEELHALYLKRCSFYQKAKRRG
jgi:shikimate kinase